MVAKLRSRGVANIILIAPPPVDDSNYRYRVRARARERLDVPRFCT
jgi:hypothetical protein